MTSREESGPGSLGFFTGVSVDDKKYESLLEDLRAHDLLGPADDIAYDAYGSGLAGRTSSSLLLHDNLSAIFSGNVPKDSKSPTYPPPRHVVPTSTAARAPPPGFASAPVGNAPTQADLEWARSQQEFALLRGDFSRKATPNAVDTSNTQQAYLYSEEDEDDDALLDNLTIQDLGLDDDDDKQRGGPPPLPSSLPPPPSIPPGLHPPSPPQLPPQSAPYPPQQPHPSYAGVPPPGNYPPPPPPPGHYYVQPPPHLQHHHHPQGPPGGFHGPPHLLYHGPSPHAIMNEKIFKVMNPRDVQFVVQQQLKQIRSSDPFSDDYYFHNYHVKRERSGAVPPVAGAALPLPSWKLEHVKAFDPRDVSRATKSREWESDNHVLGRTAKSSLYRPREMLHLDDSKDGVCDVALSRSTTPATSVFLNESWSKRQRINEGLVHLLALQDARHILDARRINVAQFHQLDPAQMDPSLVDLRNKTTTLLLELASVLGVTNPQQPADGFDRPALDGILAVSKGNKLVCRALPLLHPSARFVLFPQLVHYLLVQSIHSTEDQDRLAQTLVVALLYQQPSPPADVLAESIQLALATQTLQSLSLVLHNRLLQALLQKGGAVCATAADDVKAKWYEVVVGCGINSCDDRLKYQDVFVALASRIKETTQP
ncbi:hypothetical protein DYB25_000483 [Aphanomyces astaci]|uniref:mRNA decay factor PAT1 domain-containing protein n=1 Tax=Aphanomyces astaci TaxID=112090 RepID=A0A397FAD0_APHAT|nr:hypothetical protein DYB25_000483 [Aphanomyces astaci]RHY48115.1 hypothetical protein DYB30_006016 [Aphanomyces astaci]RHY61928.1 hypothetical protein DYB38_004590 [Aphanomyces astaci]RHZ12940.1 hypothetical protein DYB31_000402 [Aphanomyces astaci]RHZ26707.1 hypothetical protein DYB26_002766 [Aphanomyces astaci]